MGGGTPEKHPIIRRSTHSNRESAGSHVVTSSGDRANLRPKQLFQYQTIAELAAVANTRPAIQAEQGLVTGSV